MTNVTHLQYTSVKVCSHVMPPSMCASNYIVSIVTNNNLGNIHLLSVLADPKRDRRPPVPVPADRPITCVLQPVVETPFSYEIRNPVRPAKTTNRTFHIDSFRPTCATNKTISVDLQTLRVHFYSFYTIYFLMTNPVFSLCMYFAIKKSRVNLRFCLY